MSKIVRITKDFFIQAPAYLLWVLLSAACLTSWNAAIQFKELKDAIKTNWTFEMQKDYVSELGRLNKDLNLPDVYKVRSQSLSSVFFDALRITSR